MIIPISIDLSDLIAEFKLDEDQSNSLGSIIIDRVVQEYTSKWQDAVKKLNQSRAEYQKAMYTERVSPTEVIFGLTSRKSKLAMMVEEGSSPFDEKIGFTASSKVKQKKDGGWYLTIPFRHATPQAVADSGVFASILPPDIYKIAKNKNTPLSQIDLPVKHSIPGSRAEINTMKIKVPEYIHKTPQYQGLVKVDIASTPEEKRSSYMTFRRVSDKSDPTSWWNGGIEPPRKLMDKALAEANIDLVSQMVIDEFLENL